MTKCFTNLVGPTKFNLTKFSISSSGIFQKVVYQPDTKHVMLSAHHPVPTRHGKIPPELENYDQSILQLERLYRNLVFSAFELVFDKRA